MRILRWIGLAVVLVLLALAALPFAVNPNRFRPMLEERLSAALARPVKVGDLKLSLLSGGVTAEDLSIADDARYNRAPFLHAQSVTLGVDVWPLVFSHQLRVTQLTLEQPQIDLIQSPAGDWNFSSLGAESKTAPAAPSAQPSAEAMDLSVKLVKIENGRLTFSQQVSNVKSRVLENVAVEVQNFTATSAFPFELTARLAGGGDFHIKGSAGPIDYSDVAQTPAKVTMRLSGFDLASAGVENSTGLAGLVSINGAVASNGKILSVSGRLKAEKLKLARNGSPAAEPVEFDVSIEHDMHKRAGVLRRGEIHIGSAPASLTGTYAAKGESLDVNMIFAGPEMAVPQLAAMLPAFGVTLPAGSSFKGGTANARLSLAGPLEALVIDGLLAFNNTRLAGFDLGAKMSAVEKLAGIKTGPETEIQTFAATLHMAPEGSTVQDIQFIAPALGQLNGAGAVSPAQALDFKMHAILHTGGAALAMIGAKSGEGIPFAIQGTAANPTFHADVKGMVASRVHSIFGKK